MGIGPRACRTGTPPSRYALCKDVHRPICRINQRRLAANEASCRGQVVPCSSAESYGRAAALGTSPPRDVAEGMVLRPAAPPQIAVISYTERPEVARSAVDTIAVAFESDPSTSYFCRPSQRMQFYRLVLSCQLEWYPGERQVVCTLPPDAAAFVYVYPRLRSLGPWAKVLRGGLAPLLCVRPGRVSAGVEASDFFEERREEYLRAHGPFLYVSVMGVRPGRQNAGLGSALLRSVCERADAAGLHTYIEATSPRNRALYERFGFRLLQAWRGNPEMPLTYIMARAPLQLKITTEEQTQAAAEALAHEAPGHDAPGPPLQRTETAHLLPAAPEAVAVDWAPSAPAPGRWDAPNG